jgi:hypothetical protein
MSRGVMESLFADDGDTEPLRLYILRVLGAYSPERDYAYDKEPNEATFKAAVFAALDRDWERAEGRIAYSVLSELRAPIHADASGSRKKYEYGYGYVAIFLDCTFGQAVSELKTITPKYIAPFFDGAADAALPQHSSTRPLEKWRLHPTAPLSSSSSSSASPFSSPTASARKPPTTVEEYLARFDAMPWRDRQAFIAAKVRHIQTLDASQVGQLLVSPRPAADHKGQREIMAATALNERSERDQASRYNAFPNTPRDIRKKQILLCGTLLGPNSCWKLAVARHAPSTPHSSLVPH